ncbi:hypothetical protein TNCV_4853921 [Trichonephila clavipes]|nr:hypothetical protein TNCV_4853921 [Trichonephila clavipes]
MSLENSLVNVALYHIHHIWHYRIRLRESGQPIGRLRKTCEDKFNDFVKLAHSTVRSNSWDTQLAIPNDPRYARLDTNLGMVQCGDSLVTTLTCEAEHCLVEKWLLGVVA